MKTFAKLIASASFALATAMTAYAAPVTGSITIGGNDTFTSSSVTFNPTTGTVLSSTGTIANYATTSAAIALSSFNFSTTGSTYGGAAGVNLFSINPNLSFIISTIDFSSFVVTPVGNSLTVTGTGTFNETGYSATSGTFSLTTSTTGATSFQINGAPAAVTPEPSSLVLMGTGLVGAAGIMMMRRRRGFSFYQNLFGPALAAHLAEVSGLAIWSAFARQ